MFTHSRVHLSNRCSAYVTHYCVTEASAIHYIYLLHRQEPELGFVTFGRNQKETGDGIVKRGREKKKSWPVHDSSRLMTQLTFRMTNEMAFERGVHKCAGYSCPHN